MSTASVEGIQLVLRVVLAGAFIFMGVMHFRPAAQRTMAKIIPPRLRFTGLANPRNLVIFTGVCEIAGGIGLLVPPTSVAAAIALAVFLVAGFPPTPTPRRTRNDSAASQFPWPRGSRPRS